MEILSNLFEISIMSSITAGIILLIKLVFRNRLGIKWNYYIWFLLLLRLLLSYAPQSSESLFNILSLPSKIHTEKSNIGSYNLEFEDLKSNNLLPNQELVIKQNIKDKYSNKEDFDILTKLLFIIWLLGVIVLITIILKRNISFWLKIKHSTYLSNKQEMEIIRECKRKMNINNNVSLLKTDLVKTPILYGLINPKILLPINISKQISHKQLKYVLFHELSHLKRNDILINYLMMLLQIIHWFNPIIWYSFYCMRQDRELACDAVALSYLKTNEINKYGKTLINLLENFTTSPKSTGLARILESKSQIKRRINMIKLFNKNKNKLSIPIIILFSLIACITLTNAKEINSNQDYNKIEENLLTENSKMDSAVKMKENTWYQGSFSSRGEQRWLYLSVKEGYDYSFFIDDEFGSGKYSADCEIYLYQDKAKQSKPILVGTRNGYYQKPLFYSAQEDSNLYIKIISDNPGSTDFAFYYTILSNKTNTVPSQKARLAQQQMISDQLNFLQQGNYSLSITTVDRHLVYRYRNTDYNSNDIKRLERDIIATLPQQIFKYGELSQLISKFGLPSMVEVALQDDGHSLWLWLNLKYGKIDLAVGIDWERVYEVRLSTATVDYLYQDKIKVGSSLEEIIEIMGEPDDTIIGQQVDYSKNNVLYLQANNNDDFGYIQYDNLGVRIFLNKQQVTAIYFYLPKETI